MLGFVSAHAYWEGAFAAVWVLTCARVSVSRLFSATGYRRVGIVVQGLPCGPSLAVEPSDYRHLSDITLKSQFHVELFMNTAAFLSSSLSSPCVPHCPLIKSGSWSYHQTKTMGTNKITTFWWFSDFTSQLTFCSWLSTWAILHSCSSGLEYSPSYTALLLFITDSPLFSQIRSTLPNSSYSFIANTFLCPSDFYVSIVLISFPSARSLNFCPLVLLRVIKTRLTCGTPACSPNQFNPTGFSLAFFLPVSVAPSDVFLCEPLHSTSSSPSFSISLSA